MLYVIPMVTTHTQIPIEDTQKERESKCVGTRNQLSTKGSSNGGNEGQKKKNT